MYLCCPICAHAIPLDEAGPNERHGYCPACADRGRAVAMQQAAQPLLASALDREPERAPGRADRAADLVASGLRRLARSRSASTPGTEV